MNPKRCRECGELYKGWGVTGLCPSCAQTRNWKRNRALLAGNENDDEGRIKRVLSQEKRHYGEHPHCAGCPERCKQYSAPTSIILYCPRIARELEAGRPVIVREARA